LSIKNLASSLVEYNTSAKINLEEKENNLNY